MDTRTAVEDDQLPLFPRDRASDLGRALLDMAWLVIQHRTYLTPAIYFDLLALLAHFREVLIARTHGERIARDVLAGVVQRPRYGLRASAPPAPVLARLTG